MKTKYLLILTTIILTISSCRKYPEGGSYLLTDMTKKIAGNYNFTHYYIDGKDSVNYYFNNDYFVLWIIIVAVLGITTGLIFDYIIGRILGRKVLQYLLKDKYDALESKAENYGGWLLFGLSLIIAPIDIFVLVYGGLGYSFKKLIRITMLGQFIKFFGIYFFLDYFSKTTIPILSSLF